MQIERDTRGSELGPNQYEDAEGYVAPLPAGFGPRSNPLGAFPTGPEVGQPLPDVITFHSLGGVVTALPYPAGRAGKRNVGI